MERVLDVRGLSCPLPLAKARAALARMAAGDALVVLATDPEAPIDLAALAADTNRSFSSQRLDGEWRCALGPVQN